MRRSIAGARGSRTRPTSVPSGFAENSLRTPLTPRILISSSPTQRWTTTAAVTRPNPPKVRTRKKSRKNTDPEYLCDWTPMWFLHYDEPTRFGSHEGHSVYGGALMSALGVISTHDVRPGEKLGLWQDSLWQLCGRLRSKTQPNTPLWLTIQYAPIVPPRISK